MHALTLDVRSLQPAYAANESKLIAFQQWLSFLDIVPLHWYPEAERQSTKDTTNARRLALLGPESGPADTELTDSKPAMTLIIFENLLLCLPSLE